MPINFMSKASWTRQKKSDRIQISFVKPTKKEEEENAAKKNKWKVQLILKAENFYFYFIFGAFFYFYFGAIYRAQVQTPFILNCV